jgi:hypothetical protein
MVNSKREHQQRGGSAIHRLLFTIYRQLKHLRQLRDVAGHATRRQALQKRLTVHLRSQAWI